LVMVVDARDPLFYRCPDLEAYAREIDEHKRTLLLINKADLLPYSVRQKWAKYFRLHGILYLFWSAKAATAVLEGKKQISSLDESTVDDDTKIYGRE
ncbi:P-loop containing nucleoside triphosphate hydrolase superfamily protein, partial [Tanacetum coccineum]